MAEDLPFEDLCKFLQEISKKKNKAVQDEALLKFFNDIKVKIKTAGKSDCNLFPILRLLLPSLDRDRSAYNLKKVTLSQLLVKVLSLAKTSNDAQTLLKFTAADNTSEGSDFPSVAYFVLNRRMSKKTSDCTIKEINDYLDKIAYAEVGNKGSIRDEVFTNMIKSTTATQAKWFLRVVLKDLKLGLGKTRILAAMHPDAPEYYEACSSLSKVCQELDEGNTRPVEMGAAVFAALSPMLAERLDVTRTRTTLADEHTYFIENKYDGERFQLHMEGGKFEYFSRRGFTYSDKYGKTYESGLLTPLLRDCIDVKATSFILDGEMMGWHKQHQCFGSKGMAFDIKKVTDNSKYRPCYCVFDILYYNGKSLVGARDKGGVPLDERLKILDTLFVDTPGVIILSPRKVMNKISEVEEALNKAREDDEEGIVVKQSNSFYLPNRRNAGWYKIKPEYTEGAMDDLDVVIIGAKFSENKKQGLARSFYVACSERDSPGDPPHSWLAIGRVATGLTLEERERVCTELQAHWKLSTQTPPPPCLLFNKEKPDLWVLPEHSIVLTVRASELIRSTDFATDYTLRFQRVVKIRDDKPVNDVMTHDEFKALYKNRGAVVKLSNKRVLHDDGETKPVTRRKRVAKPIEVAEQFRAKPSAVTAVSQALLGRKLCILSDDEDCKKDELEALVLSHGGTLVQNIGDNTWLCIAGRLTIRARNAIESNTVDVAPTSWLRSLPPSPDPTAPPSPLDMIAITDRTKLAQARNYDMYGDSYTEPIDVPTLEKCFQKMDRDNEPNIYLTSEEMEDLDDMLFEKVFNHPMSFLRPCHILFQDPECFQALKAKYYGAQVCDESCSKLTHILLEKDNFVDVEHYAWNHPRVCIVTPDWLDNCFKKKKLVPEEPFEIPRSPFSDEMGCFFNDEEEGF